MKQTLKIIGMKLTALSRPLGKIGRIALLVALTFGIALLIGYCAVIGMTWMSIITIGGIGLYLGATKTMTR